MTTVTRSKLIYIDSDNGSNANQSDFTINFQNHGLDIREDEELQVSLTDFHAYKNWYNVNETNNTVWVTVGGSTTSVSILPGNYSNYYDISIQFAIALTDATGPFTGFTYTTIEPELTEGGPTGTGTRIMNIVLTKATHGLTAISFACRDFLAPSERTNGIKDANESYALLGGKRTYASGSPVGAFTVAIAANTVTITGFYPMQRSTCENLYLRSTLCNDNYSSKSFEASKTNHQIDMVGSNIIGLIPVDHEFASYKETSGMSYFVNTFRQNLQSIRFSVTDHRGRTIPQVAADQAYLGNFNFMLVLRAQVIRYDYKSIQVSIPHDQSYKNPTNVVEQFPNRRRIPF